MKKKFFVLFISLFICIIIIFIGRGFAEELVQSNVLEPDLTIQIVIPKKVSIFSDCGPVMEINQIVHLTSELEGFEDCEEIIYQWEVDKNDGNGLCAIEGANEDHYEFAITHETVTWAWRLTVYYK